MPPKRSLSLLAVMSGAVWLADLPFFAVLCFQVPRGTVLSRAATLSGTVPSRVALAMVAPVQEERVYTWEEMSRRGGDITSGHAHKVLAEFRVAASGEHRADGTMAVVEPALDLTVGDRFDWWGYLVRHPEGREIVGQGVTKFELRFLAAEDPNCRQQRLDFIVHRAAVEQFPHVRVHPHHSKIKHEGKPSRHEAIPVFGFLPEWLGESIPGIADGAPSPVGLTREGAEHAVPQQDVVGRNGALMFIQNLNEHNRVWVLDLTRGDEFSWHRYLRSSEPLKVGASKLLQGRRTPGRGGTVGRAFHGAGARG